MSANNAGTSDLYSYLGSSLRYRVILISVFPDGDNLTAQSDFPSKELGLEQWAIAKQTIEMAGGQVIFSWLVDMQGSGEVELIHKEET